MQSTEGISKSLPSSACMYPEHNQMDPEKLKCSEDSVYPANQIASMDGRSFFKRLFLAYGRNKGIEARIARYHNIFGPLGSWNDGRKSSMP